MHVRHKAAPDRSVSRSSCMAPKLPGLQPRAGQAVAAVFSVPIPIYPILHTVYRVPIPACTCVPDSFATGGGDGWGIWESRPSLLFFFASPGRQLGGGRLSDCPAATEEATEYKIPYSSMAVINTNPRFWTGGTCLCGFVFACKGDKVRTTADSQSLGVNCWRAGSLKHWGARASRRSPTTRSNAFPASFDSVRSTLYKQGRQFSS